MRAWVRVFAWIAIFAVQGLLVADAACAQSRLPLVAVLVHGHEGANRARLDAFRDGLRELGYVEGSNYRLEVRWTDAQVDRLTDLARELLLLKPDIAVGAPVLSAQAFARLSGTIPIVMASGAGAMQAGLVATLARPSGNVTGVTNQGDDLTQKHFELLRELAPRAERVMAVSSGQGMVEADVRGASRAAARALGITLIEAWVHSPEEIDQLPDRCGRERCDALVVLLDPNLVQHRANLISAMARMKLPAVYPVLEFATEGGLMAYAADQRDDFRRAATFVSRILKGARPAELPIEQPTRFELIVNLKAAREIGLIVPESLLARADKVIE